uniref:Kinesin-like protein n=1 Tax=Mesocestoides corti TaxID=53468 RepID=A0A5K3EVT0_MESCO
MSHRDDDSCPRIQVCVRKRPLSLKEVSQSDPDIVDVSVPGHVTVSEPHYLVDLSQFVESHTFRLDHTFDETTSTNEIYRKTAAPLLRSIFHGFMATCFAYGQTGSGKTFTMSGPVGPDNCYRLLDRGLYGMVVNDVFERLRSQEDGNGYSVTVAFFEIYCNRVYDLLNGRSLVRVLEDASGSVHLVGLSEVQVETSEETLDLLRRSSRLRVTGHTTLNVTSSRSHAVFQISLRLADSIIGRFSLVDLAGNERGGDADKETRIECGEINKSLLALKECIRAMGRRRVQHLPFRNSKLTQVLRESFLGSRSRTCMIAMVSPALSCADYTLNTLRYAQLVKELPSLEGWPRRSTRVSRMSTYSGFPKSSPSFCANDDSSSNYDWDVSETEAFGDESGEGARERRGPFSELVGLHRQLLKTLPQWFYTHRKMLRRTKSRSRDYTERLIQVTSRQIQLLTELKDKAVSICSLR